MEGLKDWQAGRSLAECNTVMLNKEINTDVTFLLGPNKEPVKCHKYILISRSSVFESIFCGNIGQDSNTIPISDIDIVTFRAFLSYLYSESVTVTAKNVKQLLYAAKKYAVKGLADHCLSYLKSNISQDNVCNILELVHQYDSKPLESGCFTYIFDNGATVLKSEGFENLCQSCVDHIIQSDELVVDETLVFEGLLRWATAECHRKRLVIDDSRLQQVMGHMLCHVRFPLMTAGYFTHNISTREILPASDVITIFQFFNGRTQPSNWKFSTIKRRGLSLFSVIRYNLILMEPLACEEITHSIGFSCSTNIHLHGVMVYGCLESTGEYSVSVELHELIKKTSVQLACLSQKLATTRSQHTYDVMLQRPVEISPSKQFVIKVAMKGPPSKLGIHGQAEVSCEGVTFYFVSVNGSKSSVERGQVPGLLFAVPR